MIPEFEQIKSLLPPSGWFIAGGSLLPGYYNNVDIYFYSEADCKASLLPNPDRATDNALTYVEILSTHKSLQLITVNFGTPDEILTSFDLNKSRQALLPSGELYQHPTFHADLYFDLSQFKVSTLDRLLKYMFNKHQIVDITKLKFNITKLLSMPLDTEYTSYYSNKANVTLIFILTKFVADYLVSFGFLLPIFEALSSQKKLSLYQAIIDEYTFILPLNTMSLELRTILYTHQDKGIKTTIQAYNHYVDPSTHSVIPYSLKEFNYTYPTVDIPKDVLLGYPEFFI